MTQVSIAVQLGLAALAASLVATTGRAAPDLRLGIDGTRLTVDGTPRFLTLVSYFDALDAHALDADLGTLSAAVDGVRIFANWWEVSPTGCRFRFSDRTLFRRDADGQIDVSNERLERLRHVLRQAKAHGLIVDLTFAADPVRGASRLTAGEGGGVCPPDDFENVVDWKGIAAAMGTTARALATPEYAHVFFDLQNEAGHRYNRATEIDLQRLVSAVRAVDRTRLISVSMYDPDADRQAALVKRLGLSMLNYHDLPRSRGWGGRTAKTVTRFRAALTRAGAHVPIYVGEPDPGAYDRGLLEFQEAVKGARQAGAAAWTFHTRVAYDLDSSSLDARLDPLTRRVLAALRTWQTAESQ